MDPYVKEAESIVNGVRMNPDRPMPGDKLAWAGMVIELEDDNAALRARVAELERLVRGSYAEAEGFAEGMKEVRTQSGGKRWTDSHSKAALGGDGEGEAGGEKQQSCQNNVASHLADVIDERDHAVSVMRKAQDRVEELERMLKKSWVVQMGQRERAAELEGLVHNNTVQRDWAVMALARIYYAYQRDSWEEGESFSEAKEHLVDTVCNIIDQAWPSGYDLEKTRAALEARDKAPDCVVEPPDEPMSSDMLFHMSDNAVLHARVAELESSNTALLAELDAKDFIIGQAGCDQVRVEELAYLKQEHKIAMRTIDSISGEECYCRGSVVICATCTAQSALGDIHNYRARDALSGCKKAKPDVRIGIIRLTDQDTQPETMTISPDQWEAMKAALGGDK